MSTLKRFVENAKEVANTLIESGLYETTDEVYKTAVSVLELNVINLEDLAKDFLVSQDKIVDTWCVADVVGRAEDRSCTITREQAIEVLNRMDKYKDCTIGLNWDVMDYHLEEVVGIENLDNEEE